MEKPLKVVVAFIGVFVAGTIFGAFFALGLGWKMIEHHVPAQVAAPATAVITMPAQSAPTATAPATSRKVPAAAPAGSILPGASAVRSAQVWRQIAGRLGLSPAQKDRIVPLIQRTVDDLSRNEQNRSRESAYLVQRLRSDIGKELTPEQRVRSEELWQKQIDRLKAQMADAQKQVPAKAGAGTTTTTPSPGPTTNPSVEVKPDAANQPPATATPPQKRD